MEIVARFEIGRRGYLDREGRLLGELPAGLAAPDLHRRLYRAMVLARAFDAKAVALQRTGQLGTYASSLGQEAIGAAVGTAMDASDVLAPNYRDVAAQLVRGVTLLELLLYWGGDERGSDFAGPREDLPVCIPVATQACHAVGVAAAMQLRRQPRAVVCTLGDGATSKGDFYEALNLAGAWGLPVVFVINNNQWAISVPRTAQSAVETLAQKAIAAGIPGEQVDGNDALAVYQAVHEGLERARGGGGASLIEALSYRMGDHTTADDAGRYRDDGEVAAHWKSDPIPRLRALMAEHDGWDKTREEQLHAECAEAIATAVDAYRSTPPPPASAMFEHLYAELPEALAEQRAELAAGAGRDDG